MRNLKQTIRTTVLYIFAVVLVGGVPMAAFADKSDACVTAKHTGKNWVTYQGACVKASTIPAATTTQPSDSPTTDPAATGTTGTPTSTDGTTTAPDATAQVQPNTTTPAGGTTVTDTTNANGNNTDNSGTKVNTGVNATTASGDAKVAGNASQGSAGTGSADTNGTVMNSVQSSVGGQTGVANFTYNVNGDVVGDITIGNDAGPVDVNGTTNATGTTNINNKVGLNNDVDLSSTSGDATVKGNNSGGSATTGDANTVASIVNLIQTIINSNQSFVGTINIYGNLNGDILLSPQFIPQLLAANNGSVTSTDNLALSTNINDDNSIVNNVSLNAASGDATVKGNNTAGSAATGSSQTNLTILNLTGHTVNAANSLLVFVNVLGTWVGLIVDAPGATAAAFGSGVVSDTTNLTDATNINNTAGITNNINLSSQSGNALVAGNSSGGSAASGNATASANIANISTSTFNLSSWFGVLFINVFGTWVGSFGVDTAAGTVIPIGGMAGQPPSGTINSASQHFAYVPTTSNQSQFSALAAGVGGGPGDTAAGAGAAALLASTNLPTSPDQQSILSPLASPHSDPFSAILMVAGFSVAGISGSWMLLRRRMEMRAAMSSL